MTTSKLRAAFLGLGVMGSGMASRLLAAGFPLAVYNRTPQKAAACAGAGARVADTPRQAADGADVIISMVADDNASRAVWLGSDGALAGVAPRAVCIESSTVSLGWIRELAAAVAQRRCEFIDAPVTGSKVHAASGELSFLVGGSASVLEKVRPLLATMSKSVVPLGPIGSGAMVKLINNFVCGVQVASLAEALAMIERSGLDRNKALDVLTSGAPGSPLVKMVSARMTAADYTPNFALRLMAKDLDYAMNEAAKLNLALETASAALDRFKLALAARLGDKDMAALFETFKKPKP